MAAKPGNAAGKRKAGGPSALPAAEFKTRCLELMDRVRETGVEYVVTKHGRPVAKLVPYVAPTRGTLVGALGRPRWRRTPGEAQGCGATVRTAEIG